METLCCNCFQEIGDSQVCPHCGYDNNADKDKYPSALPAGTKLTDRYILGKVLGQGGFGITYSAWDVPHKRKVAIKEYFPDSMASRTVTSTVSAHTGERGQGFVYGKQCFLEEAKTLAALVGNPNVARVYRYFEQNNTAYFSMEYIEGQSLKDYLKEHGKLSYQEAVKFFTPIMDALTFVHSKGIIHRDISPDNIIICKDGNVKLLDFGAARYSLGDVSRSLDVVLKHGYAPREQYSRHGRQGPFTDVYSLSATIYRSITGIIPQDSIDRMDNDIIVTPAPYCPDLTPQAEYALFKGLAVQPSGRFQSVAQFKAMFLSTVPAPPAQFKPAPIAPRPQAQPPAQQYQATQNGAKPPMQPYQATQNGAKPPMQPYQTTQNGMKPPMQPYQTTQNGMKPPVQPYGAQPGRTPGAYMPPAPQNTGMDRKTMLIGLGIGLAAFGGILLTILLIVLN